jgi:hypothetical protein
MIRAAIIVVTTARPTTHPLEAVVKRNNTQRIAQKYESSMVAIIPQKTKSIRRKNGVIQARKIAMPNHLSMSEQTMLKGTADIVMPTNHAVRSLWLRGLYFIQ